MSTENTLAAIPTDQLILKLLQELAARVEKLEKKNEAVEEQKSSFSKDAQKCSSLDNPIITAEERSATTSSSKGDEDEDARCLTCGQLLGSSCHCIGVPYGYLLDGEESSEHEPLRSIEDKAHDLQVNNPAHFARLEKLGIAGVPADGRFPFHNFWSMDTSRDMDSTIATLDIINEIGIFNVIDFDSHGAAIMYGPGKPTFWAHGPRTWRGEKATWGSSSSLRTPLLKFNPNNGGSVYLPWSAPWKRLIVFAGLSAIGGSEDRSTDDFVFLQSDLLCYFGADVHIRAWESFSDYHRGESSLQHVHTFHLSWYEVETYDERELPSKTWKQGKLYGTGWTASLQELAFTIQVVADASNGFWTVRILLPPGKRCRVVAGDLILNAQEDFPNFPLPIVMAKFILFPLRLLRNGWASLSRYIDSLLGTGDEIFDVEAHDKLIFDDDLYTRSKRYFWVINCINETEKGLEASVQAWVTYRDETLLPLGQELLLQDKTEWKKEFGDAIGTCDKIQGELEKIQRQFKEQRTRALALRDGLFSASAVMESRASTRLGENVKLLTYVSIFYLPLAFCTSIWSTTDTFGYHNLAYTMVAIGLLTYLIVFNLNQIFKLGKTNYQSLKHGMVDTMQTDERETWSKKGELFHKHRPRPNAEEPKPSEWWILVYLLQRTLDIVRFRKKGEATEKASGINGGSKMSWLARLLRKKKEGPPAVSVDEAVSIHS